MLKMSISPKLEMSGLKFVFYRKAFQPAENLAHAVMPLKYSR